MVTADEREKELDRVQAWMCSEYIKQVVHDLREERDKLRAQIEIYAGPGCKFCINCNETGKKLAVAEDVIAKSKLVVCHWNEFGPEGFEESIHWLDQALAKIQSDKK